MLCKCEVRARISLTTWAMGRSSAARTKMVRLKFEMRPSLGRDSCERIACRSQPPTRGPPKHARRATRSLKRSSAAAAARTAASDSEISGEVAGEGGPEKASEASRAAEMTCEEWYHSLCGLAGVRGRSRGEGKSRERVGRGGEERGEPGKSRERGRSYQGNLTSQCRNTATRNSSITSVMK